jgi:hypothetical protein
MTEQYRPDPLTEQARLDTYVDSLPQRELAAAIARLAGAAGGEASDIAATEVLQNAARQADLDPAAIETRREVLTNYAAFATVADDLPKKYRPGVPLPAGVHYLAAGAFFDAYLYTDDNNNKHVIKVSHEHSAEARALMVTGTALALTRMRGNETMEQIEALSYTKQRLVTRFEDGDWAAALTSEKLAAIPREHVQKMAADVMDSIRRKVILDLHGDNNLLYNPAKGFVFIDPHNPAEYNDSPARRGITLRNLIFHFVATPHETSEEAAIRLRIIDEILAGINPTIISRADAQSLVDEMRTLATGYSPPPWPETQRKSLAGDSLSTTGSAHDTTSLLTHTATIIAEQTAALPLPLLVQAAGNLAAAAQQATVMEGTVQQGFQEQITVSQEHLRRATQAVQDAQQQLRRYLVQLGLGDLLPPEND